MQGFRFSLISMRFFRHHLIPIFGAGEEKRKPLTNGIHLQHMAGLSASKSHFQRSVKASGPHQAPSLTALPPVRGLLVLRLHSCHPVGFTAVKACLYAFAKGSLSWQLYKLLFSLLHCFLHDFAAINTNSFPSLIAAARCNWRLLCEIFPACKSSCR